MKGMSVLAAVAVVLMMHARVSTSIGVSPAALCDPDCTDTADGDKVVNPNNCYEFYYCNGGAPVENPTPCPDGNYFDSATGNCLPGSCVSICPVSCDPDCTGAADGDKVVNPWDCYEFYYCFGGAPAESPTPCPGGNYFDSNTGDCLAGSCESICLPSCDPDCADAADGDKVVNPWDCYEFYYCIGGAPVESSTPCPDGNFFDSDTGDCLPGSCESICLSDIQWRD